MSPHRLALAPRLAMVSDDQGTDIVLSSAILDHTPVGLILTRGNEEILWANAAAGQILASDPGALVGTPFLDCIPEEDHALVETNVATLLRREATGIEREGRLVRRDGSLIWAHVSISPALTPGGEIVDAEGLPCVIRQFTDITERHAADEALRATRRELEARNADLERSNEELMQFAYVASHDLSEPLRVIAGHVELLAQRYGAALDDDADRWIGFAVDGCARLRTMIDDLLEYSRAGQTDAPMGPVDLAALVQGVLVVTGSAVRDAGGSVEVGPLPVVHGDEGSLFAVMQNLVTNALKFARPDVPPVVYIDAIRSEGRWVISVTDNGIGVPEQYRERVFRMFQRLHPREQYPGSGIGLAICRKVVALHGGEIWVDDTLGGGAAFRFSLPDPTGDQ